MISKNWSYIFVILMVFSSLFLPFFVSVIVFAVGSFILPRFYFGIFIFFVMDLIYGFKILHVGPFYGMLTIFSMIFYFLIFQAKKAFFVGRNFQ